MLLQWNTHFLRQMESRKRLHVIWQHRSNYCMVIALFSLHWFSCSYGRGSFLPKIKNNRGSQFSDVNVWLMISIDEIWKRNPWYWILDFLCSMWNETMTFQGFELAWWCCTFIFYFFFPLEWDNLIETNFPYFFFPLKWDNLIEIIFNNIFYYLYF